MRDSQFPTVLRRERIQNVEQDHRVNTTGHSNQNLFTVGKQMMAYDIPGHVLHQAARRLWQFTHRHGPCPSY
jgi:hypothetical protein